MSIGKIVPLVLRRIRHMRENVPVAPPQLTGKIDPDGFHPASVGEEIGHAEQSVLLNVPPALLNGECGGKGALLVENRAILTDKGGGAVKLLCNLQVDVGGKDPVAGAS